MPMKFPFLFFMVFLCFSFDLKAGDEVVQIGNKTTILKKSTSCDKKGWNNSDLNACQCCLTKHVLQNQSSKSIVQDCTKKKHCDASTLKSLAEALGTSSSNIEALVQGATNSSLVATRLNIPSSIKGPLDPNTVITFLETARNQGLFKGDINPSCTRVVESKGGWYSAQLFFIQESQECLSEPKGKKKNFTDYKSKYVLKGLKEPLNEIMNLHLVKNSPLLKISGASGFPTVTMHQFAASYKAGNKRYYFILLDAAAGKSFKDLVEQSAEALKKGNNDPTHAAYLESLEIIKKSYRTLGEQMANLHIEYMEPKGAIFGKTVVHGDFHYENVFIDPKTDKISLIDNESFARSLTKDKVHPGQDIVRIYYFSAAILDKKLRFSKVLSDDVLANVTLKPFLEGYVGRYPSNQKNKIKEELKKILLDQNALGILLKFSKGKPQVYDPILVSRLQRKYVRTIIDAL